jgi:uncharacterized protein YcbK (DUF882 family)
MRRLGTVVLVAVAASAAAAPPRFFVAGDGTLAIVNAHSGERWQGTYRRDGDGYDPAALAGLRRIFRSRDGGETEPALRLVEVLARVQRLAGGRPLTLVSGYRSPRYNEGLRAEGRKAAGGSLHTEGLAADLAVPQPGLRRLWLALRALECCGAGYYATEGFLHVDVGRPRFWEAQTSRVDENLSAGNARLFARTEYDRYAAGEPIAVRLHALTVPPVRVAPAARLVGDGGTPAPVRVEGDLREADGCLEAPASGARLRVVGAPPGVRGRLVLVTCAPRPARTPEAVETNPIEVVAAP